MIKGWTYYNHAMIPTSAPHEEVNKGPLHDGTIWKNAGGGIPLLARWTSDFDCNHSTEWWCVIKDTPFDVMSLKAKRRYEITKGKRNFLVKRIDAIEYVDELFEVEIAAFSSWPEKYRPSVNLESFKEQVEATWNTAIIYGAFDRETNKLCGYAFLVDDVSYMEFRTLRVRPEKERDGINAAIVAEILEDNNDRLQKDFYILDGYRAIRHETAFQDYLEKYFGFRKAYCQLHIAYRAPFGLVVKILYPFRNCINKEGKIGSMLYAVLHMEELKRLCK